MTEIAPSKDNNFPSLDYFKLRNKRDKKIAAQEIQKLYNLDIVPILKQEPKSLIFSEVKASANSSGSKFEIKDANFPTQIVCLRKEVLDFLEEISKQNDGSINENDVIIAGLACRKNCVVDAENKTVSAYIFNTTNKIYYSSELPFRKDSKLAPFYKTFPPYLMGFQKFLTRIRIGTKTKIKELGAGSNIGTIDHLSFFSNNFLAHVEYTATDFRLPYAQDDIEKYNANSRVKFTQDVESLFDTVDRLEEDQRFDLIYTTYTFDSVWLPQDRRFVYKNGTWYQIVRNAHYETNLTEEQSVALNSKIENDNFEAITLDEVKSLRSDVFCVKIDKNDTSLIQDIEKYRLELVGEQNSEDTFYISYPGGLLDKIEQYFENQLTENGVFLCADVVHQNFYQEISKSDEGIFKREDYFYAVKVLQRKGYFAELVSVKDFIENFGSDWKDSFIYTRYPEHIPLSQKSIDDSHENSNYMLICSKRDLSQVY